MRSPVAAASIHMEAAVASTIMTRIVDTAAKKKTTRSMMSPCPVMTSMKTKRTTTIMTKGTTRTMKTSISSLTPVTGRKRRIMMVAGMIVAVTTRAGVRKATAAAMSAKTTVVREATAGVSHRVAGVSLRWTGIRNGGSPVKADGLTTKKGARVVTTRAHGVAVLPTMEDGGILAARWGGALQAGVPPVVVPRVIAPAVAVRIPVNSATRMASSQAAADGPVTAAAVIPVAAGVIRAVTEVIQVAAAGNPVAAAAHGNITL